MLQTVPNNELHDVLSAAFKVRDSPTLIVTASETRVFSALHALTTIEASALRLFAALGAES